MSYDPNVGGVSGSSGSYTPASNTPFTPGYHPPASAAPAAGGAPAGGVTPDIRNFILQHYGGFIAWIDDPTIGPILAQAAREGITDTNILQERLRATPYWQTTSDTARLWDAEKRNDPAAAKQKTDQSQSRVYDISRSISGSIPGEIVGKVADDAIRYGWNDQQVTDALLGFLSFQSVQPLGDRGSVQTNMARVKAGASAYLLNVSDQTAFDYAKQIAGGEATAEDINAMFAVQASRMRPWLADVINSGVTLQQYFDPYKQDISKLLEISPDQVDLQNPKWSQVIDYVDKTGNHRSMTRTEASQYVRGLSEWDHTSQALDQSASLGQEILNTWGKVKV